MRNGDIRAKYKVLPQVLGEGAFGTVRSCVRRQGRHERLAVKSILKRGNAKNTTLLKNEIALVQRIDHHNVAKVLDVVQDKEYIHIVMEECRGGDLFDKIVEKGVKLSESRACEIIGCLLDAIAYLHDRDIVHRDLKAEHIMLSRDDINSPVKIIDFGLAIIHNSSDPPMTAFAGSAFTVAPEVVKRSYGKECDLWSVGVISYFLLTQRMPFNAKSDQEIFQKIVAGNFGYPAWTETGLSEAAKDFIDRLLVTNPKRRLTAKQALSHLWIRRHNQNKEFSSSLNDSEGLALVVRQEPRERSPRARHSQRGHRVQGSSNRVAAATTDIRKTHSRRSPKPSDRGASRGPRRTRQDP
jgi:serine/threonine protein kinase